LAFRAVEASASDLAFAIFRAMPILEGMKIVIDTAAETLTQINGAVENTVSVYKTGL
jgi:hypothetical protein